MKRLIKLEVFLDTKGITVVKDGESIQICSAHIRDAFFSWLRLFNALFKISRQYANAESKRSAIELNRYKVYFSELHDVNKKAQSGLYASLKGAFSDLEYLYRIFLKDANNELTKMRESNGNAQIVKAKQQ
ncbi:MAG: hypothetical protein KME47_10025 [Nodosilinea sp. WJT8-NPBG4]|jgi:hypothetical protein|nr:hypothetical protein [Nodosilinea sp. WJT8-NPBG4]